MMTVYSPYIAVSAVVLLMLVRRFRLGWLEFGFCVAALGVSILLLSDLPWPTWKTWPTWPTWTGREAFDSIQQMTTEVVLPKMDAVLRALLPAKEEERAKGTQEDAKGEAKAEADLSHLDNDTKLQYKRACFFLCTVRSEDADKANRFKELVLSLPG